MFDGIVKLNRSLTMPVNFKVHTAANLWIERKSADDVGKDIGSRLTSRW